MIEDDKPLKKIQIVYTTTSYYDASEEWIPPVADITQGRMNTSIGQIDEKLEQIWIQSKQNAIDEFLEILCTSGLTRLKRYPDAYTVLKTNVNNNLLLGFLSNAEKSRMKIKLLKKHLGVSESLISGNVLRQLINIASTPFHRFFDLGERSKINSEIHQFLTRPLSNTSPFPQFGSKRLMGSLFSHMELDYDSQEVIRILSAVVLSLSRSYVRYVLQVLSRYIGFSDGNDGFARFWFRAFPDVCGPLYKFDPICIDRRELLLKTKSFVEIVTSGDGDSTYILASMLQSGKDVTLVDPVISEFQSLTSKAFMDLLRVKVLQFQDIFLEKFESVIRQAREKYCSSPCDYWSDEQTIGSDQLVALFTDIFSMFFPFYSTKSAEQTSKEIVNFLNPSNNRLTGHGLFMTAKIMYWRPVNLPRFLGIINELATETSLPNRDGPEKSNVLFVISHNIEVFFYKLSFHIVRLLVRFATIEVDEGESEYRIYSRDYFERTRKTLSTTGNLSLDSTSNGIEFQGQSECSGSLDDSSCHSLPYANAMQLLERTQSSCEPDCRDPDLSLKSKHSISNEIDNKSEADTMVNQTQLAKPEKRTNFNTGIVDQVLVSEKEGKREKSPSPESMKRKYGLESEDFLSDSCPKYGGSFSNSGPGTAIYDRVLASFENNVSISDDVKIIFSMMLGIAKNLEQHNRDLEYTISIAQSPC